MFALELVRRGILSHPPAWLPKGAIIARVDLVDVAPVETIGPDELEELLGDYAAGRFGWLLANAVPIDPIAARGALGLWDHPGR